MATYNKPTTMKLTAYLAAIANGVKAGLPDAENELQEILKFAAENGIPSAGGGSVASADITDATAVGKSVLTAADTAMARTAIGAGTSSLALGTTSSTALAGNYAPTSTQVSTALKAKTQIAALTAASTAADIVAALLA